MASLAYMRSFWTPAPVYVNTFFEAGVKQLVDLALIVDELAAD